MLEALWSVEFSSSLSSGGGNGVVVFETGRIFGGDSSMIYVGGYKVENGILRVDVNVQTYAHVQGMQSITGLETFNLVATGTPARDSLLLSGYVVENPSTTMTIKAIRRAELP